MPLRKQLLDACDAEMSSYKSSPLSPRCWVSAPVPSKSNPPENLRAPHEDTRHDIFAFVFLDSSVPEHLILLSRVVPDIYITDTRRCPNTGISERTRREGLPERLDVHDKAHDMNSTPIARAETFDTESIKRPVYHRVFSQGKREQSQTRLGCYFSF